MSKIAVLGAGRVATNLIPALQACGHDIVEVWSKSRHSAETLAHRVGCPATWGDVANVTHEAELYIVSVKDTVLADTLQRLHPGREQALFLHTAGSMPLSLITETSHARGGVLYPMQTFSKERKVDFSTVHFFIEASQPDDEQLLQTLAHSLTGDASKVHLSNSALRRQLHLAAVFACNFSNHCYTLSDQILQEQGLDISVMLPLIEETVAKLHDLTPAQAQTGPAVRRDENVMGLQRAMLANRPDMQKLYTLLSESIMNV